MGPGRCPSYAGQGGDNAQLTACCRALHGPRTRRCMLLPPCTHHDRRKADQELASVLPAGGQVAAARASREEQVRHWHQYVDKRRQHGPPVVPQRAALQQQSGCGSARAPSPTRGGSNPGWWLAGLGCCSHAPETAAASPDRRLLPGRPACTTGEGVQAVGGGGGRAGGNPHRQTVLCGLRCAAHRRISWIAMAAAARR